MGFEHINDQRRIANTVRGWEALDRTTPVPVRRRRSGGGRIFSNLLGFAPADVDPENSASFDLAKTPPGVPVVWNAGTETQTAWNISRRIITSNTLCLLTPVNLEGEDGLTWYAQPFYPYATHIRGETDGAISAGNTGTLISVVGIDGPSSATTINSVYLPTTNKDAEDGLETWAQWNWDDERYEIYQQDCPA